jgi:hypothetical protein
VVEKEEEEEEKRKKKRTPSVGGARPPPPPPLFFLVGQKRGQSCVSLFLLCSPSPVFVMMFDDVSSSPAPVYYTYCCNICTVRSRGTIQ